VVNVPEGGLPERLKQWLMSQKEASLRCKTVVNVLKEASLRVKQWLMS